MQYSKYRNIHGKWKKRAVYLTGAGKPHTLNSIIVGEMGKGMSYYRANSSGKDKFSR